MADLIKGKTNDTSGNLSKDAKLTLQAQKYMTDRLYTAYTYIFFIYTYVYTHKNM